MNFEYENKKVTLRPHHGMCFEFYEGKGYSEDFTDHMGSIIRELENNPNQIVTVKAKTDIVCSHCPSNRNGCCESQGKVTKYDKAVLQLCKIKEGETMTYSDFRKKVKEKILNKGLRNQVCGDCHWNYICGRK